MTRDAFQQVVQRCCAMFLLPEVSSTLKLNEHTSHLFYFWKKAPHFCCPVCPNELTVPLSVQYLMIQQTPFVRRQVRKLLLFICGSKDKYRQLRDLHTLDSHVRGIKKLLEEQGIFLRASVVTASSGSALQYDTLISLVRQGAGKGPWGGVGVTAVLMCCSIPSLCARRWNI